MRMNPTVLAYTGLVLLLGSLGLNDLGHHTLAATGLGLTALNVIAILLATRGQDYATIRANAYADGHKLGLTIGQFLTGTLAPRQRGH